MNRSQHRTKYSQENLGQVKKHKTGQEAYSMLKSPGTSEAVSEVWVRSETLTLVYQKHATGAKIYCSQIVES